MNLNRKTWTMENSLLLRSPDVWSLVHFQQQSEGAGSGPTGPPARPSGRKGSVGHTLVRLTPALGRLLTFTVHVELLVKVNEGMNQLQIEHDFKGIKVSPWNIKGDFSAIEYIQLSMTSYQVFKNWSEVHPWSNLRPALSFPLNVTPESHLYHSAGIWWPRH